MLHLRRISIILALRDKDSAIFSLPGGRDMFPFMKSIIEEITTDVRVGTVVWNGKYGTGTWK